MGCIKGRVDPFDFYASDFSARISQTFSPSFIEISDLRLYKVSSSYHHMRLKIQAKKSTENFDLVRFLHLRNSLDRLDFLESMEPGSSIGDDNEIDVFHTLSG